MKDLKNTVEGLVGGTWVQFKTEDACSNTTPACPVPSDTDATYIFSLTISKLYPEVSLLSEWHPIVLVWYNYRFLWQLSLT